MSTKFYTIDRNCLEDRAKAGIRESLVRLSVGIEKVAVLLDDLRQAL